MGARAWAAIRPLVTWMFRHAVAIPDASVCSAPSLLRHGRMLRCWVPDIVVVSGPPFSSMIVGRRIARQCRVPWVADYRDLWTLSGYYALGPVRRRLDNVIESWLLRSAAMVTTVSEPLADDMRAGFGVPVEVVLNGYDPRDGAAFANEISIGRGLPLRLVYLGEIYEGRRDPDALFAALARMNATEDQVSVEFYGDTVGLVKEAAQRHGVDHLVRYEGRVPFEHSQALQREADILLLLMWDDPREHGVYSGKLFEYLGARRPILMLGYEEGVAAALIKDRQAGEVSNDPAVIVAALQQWMNVKANEGVVQALPQSVSTGLTRAEQNEHMLRTFGQLVGPSDDAGRG